MITRVKGAIAMPSRDEIVNGVTEDEPREVYTPQRRLRVQTHPVGESRTIQSDAQETDINFIVAKYNRTGQITHIANAMPQYGDFTNVGDYKEALDQVNAAQQQFMDLPSETRTRFNNDPGELIDFMSDPANTEEAIELGLAEANDVPIPQPPATPPATPPETPPETPPVTPPVTPPE